MAERAGFVWLMPPEAESPSAVVVGPSRRFEIPISRVWTSTPVPGGAGFFDATFAVVAARAVPRPAVFALAAFFDVAFFEAFAAPLAFFAVARAVDFFAVPAPAFFAVAFAALFFAGPVAGRFALVVFLPARLPVPRAAIRASPSSIAGSCVARA